MLCLCCVVRVALGPTCTYVPRMGTTNGARPGEDLKRLIGTPSRAHLDVLEREVDIRRVLHGDGVEMDPDPRVL